MQRLTRERIAKQRMQNFARELALRFTRARMPVPLALPGIVRQIHASARPRKQARQTEQSCGKLELGGELAQSSAACLLAREARQHERSSTQGFGDLGKI